jgi:predicted nuclease of predicted toxin-antitoxin system
LKAKIDEDLPRQLADLLVTRGHDAKTVVEQGWQGQPDGIVWQRVQNEGRWLFTADKGFGDLRTYPPGSHAGVVLLRPFEESRRAYLQLTEIALEQIDFEKNVGATIVITYHGVRIRRPEKQ